MERMPRKSSRPEYEQVTRPRRTPEGGEPEVVAASGSPRLIRTAGGDKAAARPTAVENQNVPSPSASSAVKKNGNWILKRGHAISYAGLFLFTAFLYFRPYEMFPALSAFSSMAFWIAAVTLLVFVPSQFALEGTLTTRPREVNLILLLTIAAFISIVFAISRVDAWNIFSELYIKVILMFIVIVNVVRTPRRLKGLMLLALSASVIVSISAVNDYRLGNFSVEGYRVTGSIQKGSGMFGDPNDMALTLLTTIPLAVALFFNSHNLVKKFLYIGCVLLMILGITFTFSRGGFLGLVFMGVALAWKLGRRNKALMFVGIVVALAGFLVLAPGSYRSRMSTISSHGGEASAMSRQELLKRSVIVSLKNPLTGVGMGNFGIVSIKNQVSHNAYTQVAAEMGIAALGFYVMFMVVPLRRLRQIERDTYTERHTSQFYYLAVGLQASIIGYMVSSFFLSVAYGWHVYYLVGYAVCLQRLYQPQIDTTERIAGAPAGNHRPDFLKSKLADRVHSAPLISHNGNRA